MSNIIAFYDSEADEVKVAWSFDLEAWSHPAGTLERVGFVDDYVTTDLIDRKVWPHQNYAAEIEDISSLTGTDGNFGVRFAINSIPDLE